MQVRLNLQYALFKKGTELFYDDIIVRGTEEVKKDKNGKYITKKEEYKNTIFIPVITGKETSRLIMKDAGILVGSLAFCPSTF
jgi:hypothetical protein